MIDVHSATWAAVAAFANAEIAAASARLERPGTPATDTELYRGQIRAMRKLLALPDPVDSTARPPVPGY